MNIIRKTYEELTKDELFDIIRTRIDVFVVEQKCPYPELDDTDKRCLHIFTRDDFGSIAAYLRLFDRTSEPGVMQIGRVLTVQRGRGYAKALLKDAIARAKTCGAKEIYLEAQVYAIGLYEKAGFVVTSDEFLEDGIPHVEMRLKTDREADHA